jgi:hypothetical protein
MASIHKSESPYFIDTLQGLTWIILPDNAASRRW